MSVTAQQMTAALSEDAWYLEGRSSDGKTWLVHLSHLPFCIGRREECDLCLASPDISRQHAEIFSPDNQTLVVREFGSTNGTYVNRQRVQGDQQLKSGDILHFGSQEFRIACRQAEQISATARHNQQDTVIAAAIPGFGFFTSNRSFDDLLESRAVMAYFQPLIRSQDDRVFGYELLGRGNFEGLPPSPGPLFEIAASLGRQIALSMLFRDVGIAQARILPVGQQVYFNTVPEETDIQFLSRDLPKLRALAPDLTMTMEVHEAAVTDIKTMREVRALLKDLNIGLAYDDFGAGQARLLELIEVPPDVLKFDIALIRNIHERPPKSRQVIATLVNMARDLGIKSLAEGTEIKEEVEVCRELGFDYFQGYYFGKPAPNFV